MGDSLLSLLFSMGILLNAFVMRRLIGRWLFPATIYALFWFGYTFLPVAGLFGTPINPVAIEYLFLTTVCFSLGSLLLPSWRTALRLNDRKGDVGEAYATPFMWMVFASSALLALLCFAINMRVQGFTLEQVIFESIQTAAMYSSRRGNSDLEANIYAKAGMVLAYLAASTGGLLFGSASTRRRSVVGITGAFLPAIAALLFESNKGLLFQFIALFWGGVLVTRVHRKTLYVADGADLRNALIVVAIVVPLTIVSFLSRGLYGVDSSVLVEQLPRYFASYAFGHAYAFSDWFSFHVGMPASQTYAVEPTGFGFYTMAPLHRLLGSTREFPPGVYEEVFSTGTLITTNIYSMFRGLIIDFGIAGSLVYMFVTGYLIHLAFHTLLVSRRPAFSAAIFIYSIGYFYSSALVSALMYNVIPSGAVIMGGILFINNHLQRRPRAGGQRASRSELAAIASGHVVLAAWLAATIAPARAADVDIGPTSKAYATEDCPCEASKMVAHTWSAR